MNQTAIGRYIARKRKEQNLTQEQLAERAVHDHRRNGCTGLYLGYPDGPFGCGNSGGDWDRRKAHARKIVLIKSVIRIERGSPG